MRALIVDDDPDTRVLVQRALEQEMPELQANQVAVMAELDEAISLSQPNILVTDFDLHWANGLDVFERVKAAHPGCVCVMFTGTGNEDLAVRAMKLGFDDYLVKGPKQLRRLATSVRLAWERAVDRLTLAENRDIVLHELYHRLHNNLQIVLSLLAITARNVPDPVSREQIHDLSRRIQTLSALQEQFYRSPDFRRVDLGAYLDSLARSLLALSDGRVRLKAALDRAEVPVDMAVPFGLVANELIMNALKHAYPNERTGLLTVELHYESGHVRLTVADDGVGFSQGLEEAAAGRGLGLQLVRRLAAQLNAEVRLEDRDKGSACTISMNL